MRTWLELTELCSAATRSSMPRPLAATSAGEKTALPGKRICIRNWKYSLIGFQRPVLTTEAYCKRQKRDLRRVDGVEKAGKGCNR
jgi:hypothetical protein